VHRDQYCTTRIEFLVILSFTHFYGRAAAELSFSDFVLRTFTGLMKTVISYNSLNLYLYLLLPNLLTLPGVGRAKAQSQHPRHFTYQNRDAAPTPGSSHEPNSGHNPGGHAPRTTIIARATNTSHSGINQHHTDKRRARARWDPTALHEIGVRTRMYLCCWLITATASAAGPAIQ
jgi:hypothetical protein